MAVDFTTNNDWLKEGKKKTVNWTLIRRFSDHLTPYRKSLVVAFLTAVLISVSNFLIPELFAYMQQGYEEKSLKLLGGALAVYFVLLQGKFGLSYVFGRLYAHVYTHISKNVLVKYYENLLNIPASDFLPFKRSTNMFQRVMDAMQVSADFVGIAVNGSKNILVVIGVGAVIGTISLEILGVLVVGVVVLGVVMLKVSPILKKYRKAKLQAGYPLVSKMLEVLDGLLTIKALSGRVQMTSDIGRLVESRRAADFTEADFNARLNAGTGAVRKATLVAAMGVGFWLLWHGQIPLSDFLAAYVLMGSFLSPVSSLLQSYQKLTSLSVNLEKYYEVMDLSADDPALPLPNGSDDAGTSGDGAMQPALPSSKGDGALSSSPDVQPSSSASDDVPDGDAPVVSPSAQPATKTSVTVPENGLWVGCKDLDFRYEPSTPVLQGVSFSIDEGEHVALIGRSGVGKTTIMRMLLGFLRPESGEVWVAGERITGDDAEASFRQHLGVVSQQDFMFNVSLRQNLLFGMKDERTDEEIADVLKTVNLWETVENLDQGLDTIYHNTTFSGGQTQRFLVARAMVRKPSVILLDEPTSSLDFESEQAVLDALDRLTRGRTTLTIAHRLSTVQSADRVLVMDEGRIVDTGPHDELMERNEYYNKLCEYNSFIT